MNWASVFRQCRTTPDKPSAASNTPGPSNVTAGRHDKVQAPDQPTVGAELDAEALLRFAAQAIATARTIPDPSPEDITERLLADEVVSREQLERALAASPWWRALLRAVDPDGVALVDDWRNVLEVLVDDLWLEDRVLPAVIRDAKAAVEEIPREVDRRPARRLAHQALTFGAIVGLAVGRQVTYARLVQCGDIDAGEDGWREPLIPPQLLSLFLDAAEVADQP